MTYDSIRAINWSSLKHLAVSPLLYRWMIDHPAPRKPAYVVGSAIHCAILEPGKFDSRYAVYDGTRRGKAWDEWQEEHPGVESLKPDEMARVMMCADAVRAHKVASRMIDGCRVEEVTTWTDPKTGLACKGRIDAISPTRVVDLKSARDVSREAFTRASCRYLYHGQLAMYQDGAIAAGKIEASATEEPIIIAIQSDAPYDVSVFQLAPETLAAGRALYRGLIWRLEQCTAANLWPGVCPDLEDLGIPPWAESAGVSTVEDW